MVTVSFFEKRPDAALPLKSKFHFQLDSVPWSIEKLFHLQPLKKDEIIISSSKMGKNCGSLIQPDIYICTNVFIKYTYTYTQCDMDVK